MAKKRRDEPGAATTLHKAAETMAEKKRGAGRYSALSLADILDSGMVVLRPPERPKGWKSDKAGTTPRSELQYAKLTENQIAGMVSIPADTLTVGEQFFLNRLRRNQTQVAAAKTWEVSRLTYNRWEQDIGSPPRLKVQDKDLTGPMACLMLRKRLCWTQQQAADKMRITRQALSALEINQHINLVKHWIEILNGKG